MASVYLAPPPMSRAVISLGLPFPALILGSWPGITHSCEILPPPAEGTAVSIHGKPFCHKDVTPSPWALGVVVLSILGGLLGDQGKSGGLWPLWLFVLKAG